MAGENVTGTLILPASQFESLAATGTPPLVVASATVVPNLNADLLDGLHATAFGQLAQANRWTAQQTFDLALLPQTNLGPALGSAAARWNNAYVGGINASGNATIAGTLGVTGAITGTLATAAQPNVTSLGTLAALAVSGTATLGGLTVSKATSGGIVSAFIFNSADSSAVNRARLSLGPQIGYTGGAIAPYLEAYNEGGNAGLALGTYGGGLEERMRITPTGIVAIGTTVTGGAAAGELALANAKSLRGANAAGTATVAMLRLNTSDAVELNLNSKPLEIASRAAVSTVSAGASMAVPATPAAWIAISLGGTKYAFPVYNAT